VKEAEREIKEERKRKLEEERNQELELDFFVLSSMKEWSAIDHSDENFVFKEFESALF
jgi:hypothetical protein